MRKIKKGNYKYKDVDVIGIAMLKVYSIKFMIVPVFTSHVVTCI